MRKPSAKSLELRKSKFEKRLRTYVLDNTIIDAGSFDETKYSFVTPAVAGERLLILLAVAFTAYNFDQSEKVMDWLKKEQLWKSVTEKEKEFFRDPDPSDQEKQDLSWRFEGAFILAWSLARIPNAPLPESECTEQQVSEFLEQVPPIGSPTEEFFEELEFRSFAEILDESLFYQIATAYFQTIVKEDKENTSPIQEKACLQRWLALKWLRNALESDWDSITNLPGDNHSRFSAS